MGGIKELQTAQERINRKKSIKCLACLFTEKVCKQDSRKSLITEKKRLI